MTSSHHAIRLFSWVVLAVFGQVAAADEREVAAVFSKAAIYVMSRDFIHEPVAKWFSPEELSILEQHKPALTAMIQQALVEDSVGGALLTSHFGLAENLPYLHNLLFRPGRPYGWEGPDYDNEEDYLTDSQYVYHSIYLRAIEETAGARISEAVVPRRDEREMIFGMLGNPEGEHYYWAKWLARKLQLLPAAR